MRGNHINLMSIISHAFLILVYVAEIEERQIEAISPGCFFADATLQSHLTQFIPTVYMPKTLLTKCYKRSVNDIQNHWRSASPPIEKGALEHLGRAPVLIGKMKFEFKRLLIRERAWKLSNLPDVFFSPSLFFISFLSYNFFCSTSRFGEGGGGGSTDPCCSCITVQYYR